MVYQPQRVDERREQIINRAKGTTPKLTNFAKDKPNWVICDFFAREWNTYDHVALAVQLGGWIEYAGGPVGEDELVDLGLDPGPIDLELLNSFMSDRDLDAKAAENGVTRIPGSKAKGEVVFGTVEGSVTIRAGTVVSTDRVTIGQVTDNLRFLTTETVTSPAGETSVTARIEAEEIGPEYNVGASTITTVTTGPGGVEGVTNRNPTSGGEGPETNTEFRERAMNAPTETSGGGTTDGIEGSIVEAIDGIEADDVNTIEHYDPPDTDPGPFGGAPYTEVVVDGGSDRDVTDVIESKKPAGIGHVLVRPTAYTVDITAEVLSRTGETEINTERIEDTLTGYLADLGIAEDVHETQLYEHIHDADEDVMSVTSMTVYKDDVAVSGDVTIGENEVARAGAMTVTVSGSGA